MSLVSPAIGSNRLAASSQQVLAHHALGNRSIDEKLSGHELLEFMGVLYDVPNDILPNRIDDLLKLFGLYAPS